MGGALTWSHQAILFAILDPGSAHYPHVLRVCCGCCALSASRLAATITPAEPGIRSGLCKVLM
ncbi:hypothetical protein C3432_14790 [Citrobacter amalonaticus]|uniref:L-asparaginase n=1 Tax=Citrobacter amalonaticus TaxID=35703 RepID=A0A2S4RWP8_CITAM|nr:hypothetical protein C3432_14790 [Citrobacter amalonaticus]POT75195.1 hypothetical protein C3436_15260 [Citrobacter amalonaticus]POU64724.1 hypothetical protein C3430_16280 [Citrobacter amalonaticus]POV04560.1 hypothetical protein C3424_15600 [Citrobacter amalonaticus]